MKKVIALCCIALMLLTLAPTMSVAKNPNRIPGGIPAFLVGCCFGIRTGTQWNEGSELHWREWTALIPYVNIVIGIWNGMDCYNGATAKEWADMNGANWY